MLKIIKKGRFVKNFNFARAVLVQILEKSVLYKCGPQKRNAYDAFMDYNGVAVGLAVRMANPR